MRHSAEVAWPSVCPPGHPEREVFAFVSRHDQAGDETPDQVFAPGASRSVQARPGSRPSRSRAESVMKMASAALSKSSRSRSSRTRRSASARALSSSSRAASRCR